MNRLKILCVFGTRPEASKMLPLVCILKNHPAIDCSVCVTAQHREMLDQVLDVFGIVPEYDLNIMKDRQSLQDITLYAMTGIDGVIKETRPDLVLVHGDTTTTFAASLTAFYNKIKVGHVEAGLRTYNKFEPYPEEMNRKLTDCLCDLYFAPTQMSKESLLKEGVAENTIYITGNTAVDAFKTTLTHSYSFMEPSLNSVDFTGHRTIVVTAHRRENLETGIQNICDALLKLSIDFPDLFIIYAVHKNPLVSNIVHETLSGRERILLTEPLSLTDMHNLFNKCFMIMTDSGGIQEEAPSLNKPVLVLRNVTERPEGVLSGALKIAGVTCTEIYNAASNILCNKDVYDSMSNAPNPFGDGHASLRILNGILHHFGLTPQRPDDFLP